MLRAQAYALAMLRCELLSEQKLEEVGDLDPKKSAFSHDSKRS